MPHVSVGAIRGVVICGNWLRDADNGRLTRGRNSRGLDLVLTKCGCQYGPVVRRLTPVRLQGGWGLLSLTAPPQKLNGADVILLTVNGFSDGYASRDLQIPALLVQCSTPRGRDIPLAAGPHAV